MELLRLFIVLVGGRGEYASGERVHRQAIIKFNSRPRKSSNQRLNGEKTASMPADRHD
jgi:hypothetical protein